MKNVRIFQIGFLLVTCLLVLFVSAGAEDWVYDEEGDTIYTSSTTVGIGTADLDGSPPIGALNLKGTSNDGSTDILVGRDSDETNVFSVDTDGILTGSALSLNNSVTDDSSKVQFASRLYSQTTNSGYYKNRGGSVQIWPLIDTGVEQSGFEMGFQVGVLRNYRGTNVAENGTLNGLYGQSIYYGHNSDNTGATPDTTNVVGLSLTPYFETGNITNLYDLYIASGKSGGTVTNRYAIFQHSNEAKNYFAGDIGIGTKNPQSKFQVHGKIRLASNWYTWEEENTDLGIYFQSKGVNTTHPDRLHTAGRIYGSNIHSGWSGQALILEAGKNWESNEEAWANNQLVLRANGNIGIGTTDPGIYKLAVEGKIGVREVVVTEAAWADYVLDDNYNLPSLDDVESFIKENKHLPDIPAESEIKEKGLSMADMMAKQMKKIEELTLYMIDMNKKYETLSYENKALKNQIAMLESHTTNDK